MKELRTGLVSAFVFTAILFVVAPMMPDLGSNRDISSYLLRWQTVGGGGVRPEFKNPLTTTATDTVSYIIGTVRDTTAVFEVGPYMTPTIILNDTSASNDSASVEFFYYSSNDNQFRHRVPIWEEWTLQDSVTVANQTAARWIITTNPVSVHKYGVIIAVGQAANTKTGACKSRIFWSATQQR